MENNPEWPNQTWIIPMECRLTRNGEKWFVEAYGGPRMEVDARLAEITADGINRYYAEQRKRHRMKPE